MGEGKGARCDPGNPPVGLLINQDSSEEAHHVCDGRLDMQCDCSLWVSVQT